MSLTFPAWRRSAWAMTCCVFIGLVLRCFVVILQSQQLTQDRDVYLGIAIGVSEGRGYCTPDTSTPTAFRPPLYPLILAAGLSWFSAPIVIAVVNIVSGLVTIWLTARIGAYLIPGCSSYLAALLVAIDPLLCVYTSQPMTECVCTMAAALWIWSVVHVPTSRVSIAFAPLWQGLSFGLLVLCRPTFWAIAGVYVLMSLWQMIQSLLKQSSSDSKQLVRRCFQSAAGTMIAVAPWVIRNWLVMGVPILTTTHGGYTLLLSNNTVFYHEVIEQPWGTVWGSESLAKWQAYIESQMNQDLGSSASESERDHWQAQRARRTIATNPDLFAESMLHRIRSLWNIAPQGEAAAEVNRFVTNAVALFYGLTLTPALFGLVYVLRRPDRGRWLSLFVLVASVQCAHLFYWTNTRMRAPLTPAIALLASAVLGRRLNNANAVRHSKA